MLREIDSSTKLFVVILQHQTGYLVYVPHKQKINGSFYSALAYTSHPYVEDMSMRQAVSYIPYATYSMGKTSIIITFTKFGKEKLLSETRNDAESCNESDNALTLH